jgi:hypothetical protein
MFIVKQKKLIFDKFFLSITTFIAIILLSVISYLKITAFFQSQSTITISEKITKYKNKKKKNNPLCVHKTSQTNHIYNNYQKNYSSLEQKKKIQLFEKKDFTINRPGRSEKSLNKLFNDYFIGTQSHDQKNNNFNSIIKKEHKEVNNVQKNGIQKINKLPTNEIPSKNKKTPITKEIKKQGTKTNDNKSTKLKTITEKRNHIEPITLTPVQKITTHTVEYHKIEGEQESTIKQSGQHEIHNLNQESDTSLHQLQETSKKNEMYNVSNNNYIEEYNEHEAIDSIQEINCEEELTDNSLEMNENDIIEYNEFIDRIKKNIMRFPGKKKSCIITFTAQGSNPENIIIESVNKNGVSHAYKAHLISWINRIEIPCFLRYKKIKIIV